MTLAATFYVVAAVWLGVVLIAWAIVRGGTIRPTPPPPTGSTPNLRMVDMQTAERRRGLVTRQQNAVTGLEARRHTVSEFSHPKGGQ